MSSGISEIALEAEVTPSEIESVIDLLAESIAIEIIWSEIALETELGRNDANEDTTGEENGNQLFPIETSTPCKKKKALVVSAYKCVRFLNTLIICQNFLNMLQKH
ncbi:hypothetical protein [Bartonella queenslandensis]|uniref:hypothetical protein n=1 Tax=Bartonella queenslandensis TaxID=481138 RepID=UPI0002DDAFEF|nr:hypothetical protein [Bartonella queenslandensis]